MMPVNREKILIREYRWRMAAVFGVLALGLTILIAVNNLLASFVIGFVIAYLFAPAVTRLERASISREFAIIIVFGIAIATIGITIKLSFPLLAAQLNELTLNARTYVKDISDLIAKSESKINLFVAYKLDISERVDHYLSVQINQILENAPTLATRTFTVLLLAPFVAFFILKDGRSFSRQLMSLVPNKFFELALSLSHQINTQMGAFIRARLMESGIVGLAVWIGLAIIGFPYAAFLALFAAITNLIPYVGPLIGAVPAYLLCLINKDPSYLVVAMSIVYILAQVLDMAIIIPLVVAKIVNLHPITVVIVIIIGSQLLGVLGMILSIPVASALKLVFTTVYDRLIVFRVG